MKFYIRCEDTYGIADILCAMYGRGLDNVNDYVDLNEDMTLHRSVSVQGCLNPSHLERAKMFSGEYTDIVTVFDCDSSRDLPLLESDDVMSLLDCEEEANLIGVRMHYIPTVFAAETIMLYQYSDRFKCKTSIDSLVVDDVFRFHLVLLAILSESEPARKAKVLRNYLDADKLLQNLQSEAVEYNKMLIDYLSGKSYGYDFSNLVEFLEKINSDFQHLKDLDQEYTVDDLKLNTKDKLYDKRQLFKFFPKTFK